MNNKHFTSFCLKNTGKKIICIKPKALVIDHKILGTFYEFDKNDVFILKGFICCQDEQTIVIENINGSEDCIAFRDFTEFFALAS